MEIEQRIRVRGRPEHHQSGHNDIRQASSTSFRRRASLLMWCVRSTDLFFPFYALGVIASTL